MHASYLFYFFFFFAYLAFFCTDCPSLCMSLSWQLFPRCMNHHFWRAVIMKTYKTSVTMSACLYVVCWHLHDSVLTSENRRTSGHTLPCRSLHSALSVVCQLEHGSMHVCGWTYSDRTSLSAWSPLIESGLNTSPHRAVCPCKLS